MRDGTVLREKHDSIEYGDQLITTYAVEMANVPVYKSDWRGRKTDRVLRKEPREVRVPIKSWPYSAIKDIDWGYITPEQYTRLRDELAEAKQAADAKRQEKSNERLGDDQSTSGGSK